MGQGIFEYLFEIFVINPFAQKKKKTISNQLDFESKFLQISPESLKFPRYQKFFRFLRFSEVIFRNLSIFIKHLW